MNNQTYDVVIVGAGISGAMCARQLSNKGYNVLILDAGKPFGDRQESIERYYVGDYPFPGNHASPAPDYPNPGDCKDPKPWKQPKHGYWTQSGDYAFGSTYDRFKGGSTNHWLATALRNFPDDLKLKSKLKCESPYARDWPFEYDDLEPYYALADVVLGVSGDPEFDKMLGIPRSTPYPMPVLPLSYSDQQIAAKIDGMEIDVLDIVKRDGVESKSVKLNVETTPQARNSTFYANRPRCMGNSSCVPICPIQAKWDATVALKEIVQPLSAEEIKSGSKRIPVTIQTQSVVHKVEIGEDEQVCGLKYYAYSLDGNGKIVSKQEYCVTAKIYVMAAHAIETPKILLNSTWTPSSGPKAGQTIAVANTSDQVGRNLMDHICLVYWGLTDGPVYQYRGPGSTGCIPQFRNVPELRKNIAAMRIEMGNFGWSWPTFAPPTDIDHFIGKGLYGKELREALADRVSREFRVAMELESVAVPDSRVTLSEEVDDLGIPRPNLNYVLSNYTIGSAKFAEDVAMGIFKQAGIEDRTFINHYGPGYFEDKQGNSFEFRGAGHIIGTYLMGDDPCNSVVNAKQQSWDHSNLYMLGSGTFPTTATANPTLTIAAMSLWAGDSIAEQLKGGC